MGRTGSAATEERLLPLFWVLNRIKQESEIGTATKPNLHPFKGALPGAHQAAGIFREALLKSDKVEAERAGLALARDHGARHVLYRLWEFAGRNLGGNLGHPAIALANSLRALEVMGWQHADIALRYVTRYIAGYKGDKTYTPNLERVKQTLSQLAVDWAGTNTDTSATLELYKVMRNGNAEEASGWICSHLLSGKAKAGSVWDAISLTAADTVFRHKTGGGNLGAQIHAVTTTNALRFGFNLVDDPQTKLILLLQAAGVTCDFYIRHVNKEGKLRDIGLLDLKNAAGKETGTIADVFALLPFKARDYVKEIPEERAASDKACRMAFALLGDAANQGKFMQAARSFLCVKASLDPHDIKYPAAAFEESYAGNPEWRPYLLASSVHSLHGTKSNDTPVLLQVKDALT